MYNVTVWNGDGWVFDSSYSDIESAQNQLNILTSQGSVARIEYITSDGMTIL